MFFPWLKPKTAASTCFIHIVLVYSKKKDVLISLSSANVILLVRAKLDDKVRRDRGSTLLGGCGNEVTCSVVRGSSATSHPPHNDSGKNITLSYSAAVNGRADTYTQNA